MRFKIYDKTAEILTSLGCAATYLGDPFSILLLIGKGKYTLGSEQARLLIAHDGFALCRLECSFYSSELKHIPIY